MKLKKMLALLLAVLLLPVLALADEKINTVEEMQAYLAKCREESLSVFVVSVPSELGKELSADNNALLDQMMQQVGVEEYDVRISRNTKLTFNNVKYGEILPDATLTVEDAKAAIAAFLPGTGEELTLVCADDVFQYLFREGGIHRVLAELGVQDATVMGNSKGLLFISEVQMMTVPYACVSSVSEAGEKIALWAESQAAEFNLIFDMDVYATITRDDQSLMTFLGGVENYSLLDYYSLGMLNFSQVTYASAPGVYCQSEDEVVNAIRAMGAKGFTSFRLKLDQPTFDKVKEGFFERLSQLQAQAGMTGGDLRYSNATRMLLFDNAVIQSDVTILHSLQEVTAQVEAAAKRGDKDIVLLMDAGVYAELMEGVDAYFVSDAKFYDLIGNAGICGAEDIGLNRTSGLINLKGVKYYAGTNILRALENGDESVLTEREQQALAAARTMAEECRRDTDVATALAIHDALCALVTYVDDADTEEDDCCIGALLDGRANCDGYSDAMLLVGKLAGLNVRYQHGDSLKGGLGSLFYTHMWNLVELDGAWRMIDVTWDDLGDQACHLWFNIGEDRAALSHVWSSEMTVPMLPTTDPASRPVPEYTAANEDEVTAAILDAQLAGHKNFDLYVIGEDLGPITVREALRKGLLSSASYSWIDALRCAHVVLGE